MTLLFVLKYFSIGFAMASPIGPMSTICMRRTLKYGFKSGICTAAGMSTIDGFYCAIIAFGVTLISSIIKEYQFVLGLFSGAILIFLGIKIFLSAKSSQNLQLKHSNLWHDYLSSAAMSLVNPMTIFSFMAVFVGFGFGNIEGHKIYSFLAVISLFCGSITWYFIFVNLIEFLRKKFNSKLITIINHLSGTIIIGFGVISIVRVVFN